MMRRLAAGAGVATVALLAWAGPASAGPGDSTDQSGGGGGSAGDSFLVWSLAHASHQAGTAAPIPCEIEQPVYDLAGQQMTNPDGSPMTETVQGHIAYSDTLNSQEVLVGITGEEREGRFIRVECNGPDIVDDDIRTLLSVPFIVSIDAVDLLDVSLASMGIPEPPINMSPGSGQPQLVNLETWMWLDPSYWDPRTLTTSASVTTNSGFVVTISTTLTAVPQSVRWDMGDGTSVTCDGPGTAYDSGAPAASQSTDCGHTYRKSSATQPGNAYDMTATVTWGGTYTVSVGGGGDLGTLDVTSDPVPVRVAESQAIVGR